MVDDGTIAKVEKEKNNEKLESSGFWDIDMGFMTSDKEVDIVYNDLSNSLLNDDVDNKKHGVDTAEYIENNLLKFNCNMNIDTNAASENEDGTNISSSNSSSTSHVHIADTAKNIVYDNNDNIRRKKDVFLQATDAFVRPSDSVNDTSDDGVPTALNEGINIDSADANVVPSQMRSSSSSSVQIPMNGNSSMFSGNSSENNGVNNVINGDKSQGGITLS